MNQEEFEKLFYDFRFLVVDLNSLLHLLLEIFCKVKIGDFYPYSMAVIVEDLYDIRRIIERNTDFHCNVESCFKYINKKSNIFIRQIRKGLKQYGDILVVTEEGDRPLKSEFEYCKKVCKQNLNILKKWCDKKLFKSPNILGSEYSIKNDSQGLNNSDFVEIR